MDFRRLAARLRGARTAPGEPVPAGGMLGRAAEVARIVDALREPGMTVTVHGPAGSGTTTLARLVRADPRIERRFRGVHWVTLGPHARLGALAGKVSHLVRGLDPAPAHPASDVADAAGQLATVLAGQRPHLLILDDVRSAEQLAAFPVTGRSARLVTTRDASLAAGAGLSLALGRVPPELARSVLMAGRPPLPEETVAALASLGDGLPRSLRRANRLLADRPDPRAVAFALERDGAVTALADLLKPDERDRWAELAVFADDAVPVELVLGFWFETGRMTRDEADALLSRLADLRLIARASTGVGATVRLPGAAAGAPALHAALLDSTPVPADSRYLRHHYVEHLLAAGREPPGLDWLAVRLERDGLAGPLADLARRPSGDLRRTLARAAHLLAPTDPPHAVTDILHSRLPTSHQPVLAVEGVVPDPLDPALIRTLAAGSWTQALAVAPDGSWLAAGTVTGEVRAWNLTDGSLRLRIKAHPEAVHALAIAPNGGWLVTAGNDHLVRLWDAATGEARAELDCGSGPVWTVAISPDGSWLVTGGEDGTVRLWDAVSGRPRRQLRGPGAAARSVAIAPDGGFVASGDFTGQVRVFNPGSGRKTLHFSTGGVVSALAVSPSSRFLATAHWSSPTRRWDLRTMDETRLGGPAQCLVWAPDERWLAVGGIDNRVLLWTASGRELRRYPGHRGSTDSLNWVDGRVDALAVAPGGQWLATGGQDELVRVWEAGFGPRSVPAGGPLRAVSLSPDGRTLLTATDQAINIGSHFVAAPGPVSAAAVADDGAWFVLGDDRTIRDTVTGGIRSVLRGHQGDAASILIAPGGSLIATWGPDAPLQLWDSADGRALWQVRGVTTAAFSPDGGVLVVATTDHDIVLVDPATGTIRRRATDAPGLIGAVAVTSDGWKIAVARGPALDLFDLRSRQRTRFRTAAGGLIRSLAISPDGDHLATVDSRRAIQIWHGTDGAVAMMRLDQVAYACTWTSPRTLSVAGAAGLYRFHFRPPATGG
ncbi:NB-ARC domain-containing protein [Actinoplanes sp. NPDC051411]|uniref:NB-ARC domain-containing protein n=1 Tax=Actinoplanes sp. NPDC051411 TaxID=3155522 RepID=UPI00343C2A31